MMQDRRIISRWVRQKGMKKPPGGGKKKHLVGLQDKSLYRKSVG
jgi:hypothetical protein